MMKLTTFWSEVSLSLDMRDGDGDSSMMSVLIGGELNGL